MGEIPHAPLVPSLPGHAAVLRVLILVLAALTVALTALPLSRAKAWWVRMWDFPRVQVAAAGVLALGLWWSADGRLDWPHALVPGLVGLSVAFQAGQIWRYTRLAPREVQPAERPAPEHSLSLVVCNVLESNREADTLLRVVQEANADVVLLVETDQWWHARMEALSATHPHALRHPIHNTYGMLLYSRLPLEEARVEFLLHDDIPSIQARVRLRGGTRVWLNCVHPRPPAPGEADESLERDAELLLVGRRVQGAREPVVVCGDLNDVAWSRTTRLFQKVSRLLDPRKGRGLFPTFHARWPGLRWPLDHVFHSDHFRLTDMRRLDYVGSDHFPVYVCLSYEPDAVHEQEAPAIDAEDQREATETIVEAVEESRAEGRRSVEGALRQVGD